MNYTIVTRARRNGIHFEPHELEPLSIGDGSMCWGVWVEGRRFDEHTRLNSEAACLANESPHMVVSPLHPDAWPGAFSIKAYLQRQPNSRLSSAPPGDAFHGFADALSKLGVNILLMRTAQAGYDSICFSAVCELPALRPHINELLRQVAASGRELDTKRMELRRSGVDPASDPDFQKSDDALFLARVAAFRDLGALLLPRLAGLELQLLAMENLRYLYQVRCASDANRDSMIRERLGDSFIATGEMEVESDSREDRINTLRQALHPSWFFNKKVIEAGENIYFLSYASLTQNMSIDTAIGFPRSTRYPQPVRDTEDGGIERGMCVTVRDMLHRRDLSRLLQQAVMGPNDASMKDAAIARPNGTSERVGRYPESKADRLFLEDFYRRQAIMPIAVSALPMLAFSRFWAFGGGVGRGLPQRLRYQNHLLRADTEGGAKVRDLSKMWEFLNETTRAGEDESRGHFGPYMSILAGVDVVNQSLRVRFVRDLAEPKGYVTFAVTYLVSGSARGHAQSGGLVQTVAAFLTSIGLRVERCQNFMLVSEPTIEKGRLQFVSRAATKDGIDLCTRVGTASDKERQQIAQHWAASLVKAVAGMPNWRMPTIEVDILSSLAPENR